ncbi:hypothetical protein VaNZ11_002643 [Volvox africanus]|uniref:Ubiquitin thioesterase OTU n=1 Tax=Volvox africanus TaxID=51714 RepID=A0ABQ5RTD4_9CHLO|nr:hypothetical protein VaNZ11_002643 [Volvox africanus]
MLTIRHTVLARRNACTFRKHCMVRLLGAAGWPDLSTLFPPGITAAMGSVIRRETLSSMAPSRSPASLSLSSPSLLTCAANFSSATSGGDGNAMGASQQPPQSQQQVRFRLRRISGDGACMFRAIAQGAQMATHGKAMSLESEEVAALNLRQAVVRELRRRREEIEPFLPGIAADFDEYCRTMSNPMAWGGEPEMVMAVHVVQRPIMVYHVEDGQLAPIVTYGDHLLGSAQPISLLWSGAHYDLLVLELAAGTVPAAAA